MSAGKRYVLIFSFILIYFVDKSVQNEQLSNRKRRHFFPLLGYLHGYKSAQNYFQYPPYFFPPIILLPSVTQQQAINVQKSYSDESYQENGGIFQYIQSAKLILNRNLENDSKPNKSICEKNSDDDKDVARQVAIDFDGDKENFKLSNNRTANIAETKQENTTIIQTLMNTADDISDNSSIPVSKNTTDLADDFVLPSNQTHNFATGSNTTNTNATTITPAVMITDNNLSFELSDSNETYPNSWYNNGLVDKIRLTTNDVKSTSKNDEWYSEPSINSVSGFRPLAGLYYDGFLDKPVTKRSGFTPIKSKRGSQFLTLK